MNDSPFNPVDPDLIIAETDDAVAFLDGYPVSEGHTLVVPREVVKSLYELDLSTQSEIWKFVAEVRNILKNKFNPDGFNIGINDGDAAGQTIPHAHIHIIPRYKGDTPDPRGGIRWILPDKAKYWKE